MKKDLTVGSPLKLIIYFTIPLLIGNLFQQLYNTADTMIVGRTIGFNALAAVGVTGYIIIYNKYYINTLKCNPCRLAFACNKNAS